MSLMVDAEDGFGNAVNVIRTVQEMEAAGDSAVEIEDNVVPRQFNVAKPGLVSQAEQVGKLKAAVAARRDPTTVIVARTSALAECPLEEALDRIRVYADTGPGGSVQTPLTPGPLLPRHCPQTRDRCA